MKVTLRSFRVAIFASLTIAVAPSSEASAQNSILGEQPVSFDEAALLFFEACIGQAPDFGRAEEWFRRSGLELTTVTGGLAHKSKALTGRNGSVSAQANYCEVSALIKDSRKSVRTKFAGFVLDSEPSAVLRKPDTFTAKHDDLVYIYQIESSLSSGRSTFSLIAGLSE